MNVTKPSRPPALSKYVRILSVFEQDRTPQDHGRAILDAFKERRAYALHAILLPKDFAGIASRSVDFVVGLNYALEQEWISELPGPQWRLEAAGWAALLH